MNQPSSVREDPQSVSGVLTADTGSETRYPNVTKKEVVRAAFYAITETSSSDQRGVAELHDFALVKRGSDEHGEAVSTMGKRKKKHRSPHTKQDRQTEA